MIGKKGLFGRAMPGTVSGYDGGAFRGDGTLATLPDMRNVPTTAGGRFGDTMPAPRQRNGGGFFGEGGVGRAIAGTIGDVLLQQSGLAPVFAPQMQMQQVMAFRQAEEQRRRAAELADFRTQMQIKAEFEKPEAPKPRFEQDGAGNLWALDPVTGRQLDDRPVFVDRTERIINQNGALIRIPNPFAGQVSPQAAPDRLPADFFDDDGPQRPNASSSPAQRVTGARRISPQQYQAQLRQFGGDQTSMNAWMRANNVLVGN